MINKKNPFTIDSPGKSTGFLFYKVSTLWQRGIKKLLKEYNLTHTQFVLTAGIYWNNINNVEITQKKLSLFTNIDQMVASASLKTLAAKDYIKISCGSDPRANSLTVTNKGTKVLNQAVVAVEKFDLDFFAKIKEQDKFRMMLSKLM